MSYAIEHPNSLKYADSKVQWDFIKEYPEFIKTASEEIQEKFILQDRNNLSKTSDEFQLKTICKHPNAYNFASDYIKRKVFEDTTNSLCMQAIGSLLKKDIKNTRYYTSNIYDIVKGKAEGYKPINDIFRDINKEDSETIKNLFLYSKLMSAKGKLLKSETVLHGTLGETDTSGIDDYTDEQISIIQSLNINQIQDLIRIDSNYVLPYLVGGLQNEHTVNENEIEASKNRCKELFSSMFGSDKLKDLETCIDIIYEQQSKMKKLMSQEMHKLWNHTNNYRGLHEMDNIPLDHFKILFNSNIISLNSPEDIKDYFDKLSNNEDTNEIFKKLMENAYGDSAREILESRPKLNVHTINSLESFDKRILDNFELGFVHDLLSYNIRDFSSFLAVVKDEARLKNFKTYYEVLSNIMGENVETMQRAISEFIYNEELLKDVSTIDLTDAQERNLISVLCSKENKYDINSLDDLNRYNEIANQKSMERLKKAYDEYLSDPEGVKRRISYLAALTPLKKCICEEFLGIDYAHAGRYITRDYGDSYKYIMALYDLQSEISKTDMYTENELDVLNVMNFLNKENNPKKLMEFANNLLKQENIRNPIELYSAIDKVKEHQLEIFNDSLLTVDKMEELCKSYEGQENPPIKKELIGDVPKYTLQGVPFNILLHDSYGLTLQDFLDYEGQLGNNAICSRDISDKVIGEEKYGNFGFTNIEVQGGIIANSNHDANTNHIAKLVRGDGIIDKKVIKRETASGSETAFYRRYRDHKKINNENHGGKRLPDVYVTYYEDALFTEEFLDFLRKNNIPIVYIDVPKYKELNEQNKQKSVEDNNLERE